MKRTNEIAMINPATRKEMKFDEKVSILENMNIVTLNDAEKYLYDTTTYPNRFFNFDMNIEEINKEYERLKQITRNKFELNKQYELFIKINEMDEIGLLDENQINQNIDKYESKYDERAIDFVKCQILKEEGPTDEEIERTCNYLNDDELCKEIYELGCKFANEETVSMMTGIGSMANFFN